MANYSAPLLYAPVTTTFKTTGALWAGAVAGTPRRFMVYEAEIGQATAAAGYASTDIACQWDLSRFSTGALVGATVVVNSYDIADLQTAITLFVNAVTTEPTYTTAGSGLTLKSWGINQRGSYRWRALDDGDNIICPATVAVGVGIRTLSAGFAGSAVGNVSFVER
jgi:hypothetical protein